MTICGACVVRDECLAKHINERVGIWGGTTGRQRQIIRTKRDRDKPVQGRNNKAQGGGNAERQLA